MVDLTLPYVPSQTDPTQVLLPENRTKLETDLVRVQARTTDVPVPYRTLFDPYKCPSSFLPWLASNWSVDLWYDDWTDTTKRKIIYNIVSLHRQKGTLTGIENYLSYVSGVVVKAVTPPASAFYLGALTPDQRLAFVNSLPQIDISDYQEGRQPPGYRSFMTANADVIEKKNFYGVSFYQKSAGPILYGRKATFFDPLNPQIPPAPVTYASFADPVSGETIEQCFISFASSKRSFMGHCFMSLDADAGSKVFMQSTRAAENMISVVLDPNASKLYATFSGDNTYNVQPQTIFQQSVARNRSFYSRGGSAYGHSFYARTTRAPSLIYDRISIYDASRVPTETKARSFYGKARFGIAPYNAELTVTVPMFRGRFRMNQFYGGISYMKSWNPEPLYRVLDAIRVSKSERDKILVQPQTHQTVRLSSALHLGSFSLGELVSTI